MTNEEILAEQAACRENVKKLRVGMLVEVLEDHSTSGRAKIIGKRGTIKVIGEECGGSWPQPEVNVTLDIPCPYGCGDNDYGWWMPASFVREVKE